MGVLGVHFALTDAAVPRLDGITSASLRARYDALDPGDYAGPIGNEDFEYTWENFVDLRDFWRRAAEKGRSVLFTVDQ